MWGGATKSLEDYAKGWARDSGVAEVYETWLKDLTKCGIGNLEDLETVARYASDWEKLLEKTGPPFLLICESGTRKTISLN